MIHALRVHNLAVIEELALELGPGLTVLTGETGAGKSVLLQAVALLCGWRVTSDVIRTGHDEARVEAILSGRRALARARERGLARDEDQELLLVRTLSRAGRGRVFINGSLATLALLQQLLADEIELTSQGEHQRLLQADAQAEVLDQHGELAGLSAEVARAYRGFYETARELHDRRVNREERARREDLLRYEVSQIERVSPRPGELEELDTEQRRLAHVEALAHLLGEALHSVEGEGGARERLNAARSRMQEAASLDSALAEPAAGLERAELELAEAARSLERYGAELAADPERLAHVEARLGELARLFERYGSSVEAVLEYGERSLAELERLGGGEERSEALERELETRAARLEEAAGALGKSRRQAGLELAEAVTRELRSLDLGKARFEVVFEPIPAKTPEGWPAPSGPRGTERPVFLFTGNPGEDARRVRDAASGGELARLLLALRNALRATDEGGLLVFDEVDAGIGGRTAGRLGERLRALARSHQVLCITHLAPIAALADAHYRVDKRVRAGRTRTRVAALEGEQRIEEIARMSGGGRVTETARAHARELLNRA